MTAERKRVRRARRPAAKPTARRRAAIATVAGLAAAVSGCGAADPPASILTRAAASDASFGVRYRFQSRVADDKGTHRLRGYGQAEADQRRSRVVVLYDKLRLVTVLDGDDEYSGGDLAATVLLTSSRGVRWTKLDRKRFLDAGYLDKVCGAELPAKVAGALAHSHPTIAALGAARIDDRGTRHYRVTTTYGKVLDALSGDDDATSQCDPHDRAAAFTADLWIDRDGLIRRVRLRYRTVDGAVDETRDMTGYDRRVRVAVPSGPIVGDVTDRLLKLSDSMCKTTDDC